MLLHVICLASAGLAPVSAPSPVSPPSGRASFSVPATRGSEDGAFERLEDEYDEASREWRKLVRDARKAKDEAELARLNESDPVRAFYPRFEALAGSGSARAALWAARHVEEASSDPKLVLRRKGELYAQAVAGLADTDEAKSLLRAIDADGVMLGASLHEALLKEFGSRAKDVELQADAQWSLARSVASRAADEAGRKQVVALLEEIEQKYPDTKAAKHASDALYEQRHLSVGATAPGFETEDVDGVRFSLSDYRGKVVLLDFWGFW